MYEIYQKQRLDFIKEILPLLGENFILKGGTALNLYYNLDRFSEDIDLDCKSNNMNFINKLKYHKDFKKWHINIKKDTDMVFRAMIDYGAKSHLGDYPLKIEVSTRNKQFLQNHILQYNNINGVQVYHIDELIKMKVTAFSGRDKIRDFYDLGFLLQTHKEHFSNEALISIHQKITYVGADELNLLLYDEINTHKLTTNKDIYISQNYAQKMLENIENIINENNITQNLQKPHIIHKKRKIRR